MSPSRVMSTSPVPRMSTPTASSRAVILPPKLIIVGSVGLPVTAMPLPLPTFKPKSSASVIVTPVPAAIVWVSSFRESASPLHSVAPETGAGQDPDFAGEPIANSAPSATADTPTTDGAKEIMPTAVFRRHPPLVSVLALEKTGRTRPLIVTNHRQARR